MRFGIKNILLLITIILICVSFINANSVYAVDLDNDEVIDVSQSLDEEEETDNEVVQELPSTDLLSPSGVTQVSSINNISSMNLSLNNILLIILIPIGVLLILFAIAILIRLKKD